MHDIPGMDIVYVHCECENVTIWYSVIGMPSAYVHVWLEGVGMFELYMLKIVRETTCLCGNLALKLTMCRCYVSEGYVCFALFDIICIEISIKVSNCISICYIIMKANYATRDEDSL